MPIITSGELDMIPLYSNNLEQKEILDLIQNEKFHYVEPRHKTAFLDTMWKIGQAIRKSQIH